MLRLPRYSPHIADAIGVLLNGGDFVNGLARGLQEAEVTHFLRCSRADRSSVQGQHRMPTLRDLEHCLIPAIGLKAHASTDSVVVLVRRTSFVVFVTITVVLYSNVRTRRQHLT